MENTKKPITPLLKKLKVGEKEEYPIRRGSSVETAIGRTQRETKNSKEPKMFSYRTIDKLEKVGGEAITLSYIEVTRIS